jgi:hypothetical protein
MTPSLEITNRPAVTHRLAMLALVIGGLTSIVPSAIAQTAPAPREAAPAAEGARDFSVAERTLLMSSQLAKLELPATLRYAFERGGTLEAGFTDAVVLRASKRKAGGCCVAEADFLGGERKIALPVVEDAEGNPVTMYFLEHDIREMKRLTKGSTTYFRKQIRMALYQDARVDDVEFAYKGQTVKGRQIAIEPYRNDPNRARFESLVRKQYVFTLSDAVPGVVAAIRTVVHPADAAATKPVWTESLLLEGVAPPALPTMRPVS